MSFLALLLLEVRPVNTEIEIGQSFFLPYEIFPNRYAEYIESRRDWLNQVSQELEQWKLEDDRKNYLRTVNMYFVVYTLVAIESFRQDFNDKSVQSLIDAQFWLCMQARFADDVLDNDSGGVGFENSFFLSHYCLSKAESALIEGNAYTPDLRTRLWKDFHLSLSYHMELTRPFGKVDFHQITSRHWQRGSQMFWLPGCFAESKAVEALKSYFNFFVAGRDLLDIFADQMHHLNTPAVVALQLQGVKGSGQRWKQMRTTLLPWLKGQKELAVKGFTDSSMEYGLAVTGFLWDVLSKIEELEYSE